MKKILSVLTILLFLFLVSCQKESSNNEFRQEESKNFVSKQKITELLAGVSEQNLTKSTGEGVFGTISTIDAINGKANTPDYYVINYEGGGFVIMSADDRIFPILAYSEDESFPVGNNDFPGDFPGGLEMWMHDNSTYLQSIKDSQEPQSEEMEMAWRPESIKHFFTHTGDVSIEEANAKMHTKNDPAEDWCQCFINKVGPITNVQWHQRDPYNSMAPLFNLEQAVVGCVPLAVGQIFYHHKKPTKYNYSTITGTNGIAQMLRDIGDAYSPYIYWGVSSTGVQIGKEIEALKKFGYTYEYFVAPGTQYFYTRGQMDIDNNCPFLFTGHSRSPYLSGSHTWVCDGYDIKRYCGTGGHPTSDMIWHWSMKWGWTSGIYNGWYLNIDFSVPAGYNFTGRDIIHTIRP